MKKPTHDMSSKLYDYLGHFRKDEYLCKGHNDSGKIQLPFDKSDMDKFSQSFNAATNTKADESKPNKSSPQTHQQSQGVKVQMDIHDPATSTGQAY